MDRSQEVKHDKSIVYVMVYSMIGFTLFTGLILLGIF